MTFNQSADNVEEDFFYLYIPFNNFHSDQRHETEIKLLIKSEKIVIIQSLPDKKKLQIRRFFVLFILVECCALI